MRKMWISLKCGLSRDPKHRRQMANSIWLFMHMLDLADWDTGIIADWRDTAEADEMGMELRTLREQRRELERDGYITCAQKQHGQEITIHNWTNPREYTGEIYNKKQGDNKTPPSQGYIQGYIQGSKKNVTPTYSPNTKESLNDNDENARAQKSVVAQAYEREFGGLTPMIADAIRDAEKDYEQDWIIEAMQIAVERNVRNWRFVLAILANCKAKNVRPSLNKLEAKNGNTGKYSSGTTKSGSSRRTAGQADGGGGNAVVEETNAGKLAEINRRRRDKSQRAPVAKVQ